VDVFFEHSVEQTNELATNSFGFRSCFSLLNFLTAVGKVCNATIVQNNKEENKKRTTIRINDEADAWELIQEAHK